MKVLIELIEAGAASTGDRVWRNTCDWLIACKVSLHLLTLRHDSKEQVEQAEKTEKKGYTPATHGAYFGIDRAIPLGSSSSTQASYGQISIVPLARRRFPEAAKIVLIEPLPLSDPEELKRILSYEVQLVVAREQPESDEDKYRSEFNARWVAGYHKDKSDRPLSAGTVTVNKRAVFMQNARQAAIFADVYNTSDFAAPAWEGRRFQNSVYKHHAPQGKNLLNSLRIDNLYLAMTKSPVNLAELGDAIKALTDEEKVALRSAQGGMVQAWHDILREADLPDSQKAVVAKALGIYGFSP